VSISELTRREIVDRPLLRDRPFYGQLDLISFLKRVWELSVMPSRDHRFKNAEGDIWQHMVRNMDWTDGELLYDRLNILTVSDETFLAFIEACVHPIVVRDETVQSGLVGEINGVLARDGYSLWIETQMSGHPIYKAVRFSPQAGSQGGSEVYEVVLSFAGEDRGYVEEVAHALRSNGVSVFYDRYEEVSLWGKDLHDHLDKVYRGSARYCVMFISRHYKEKVWASHERRSAFARALAEKEEYILPARFDDTEIPGLRPTLGYVDLTQKGPEQLAEMIIAKLGRVPPNPAVDDEA
jgi:hypothetical protein